MTTHDDEEQGPALADAYADDLAAGKYERAVDEGQDAPNNGEEPLRMRRRREKAEQIMRGLAGKYRAATYRRLMVESDLPDGVKCMLVAMIECGSRLENCFPGPLEIARRMGAPRGKPPVKGQRRHGDPRIRKVERRLAIAVRRGWLDPVELQVTRNDGSLGTMTGYVFTIPPGVLSPKGWRGPEVWTNRDRGKAPDPAVVARRRQRVLAAQEREDALSAMGQASLLCPPERLEHVARGEPAQGGGTA